MQVLTGSNIQLVELVELVELLLLLLLLLQQQRRLMRLLLPLRLPPLPLQATIQSLKRWTSMRMTSRMLVLRALQ